MMRLEELKGKGVLSSDGSYVGEVDGAILSGKWNIDNICVKVEKDVSEALGERRPLFFSHHKDIKTKFVDVIGDKVILNKTLMDLKNNVSDHNESAEASRIKGLEIVDKEGMVIGEVEDIIIDTKRWELPFILVEVDRNMADKIKIKKSILKKSDLSISMKHVSDVGEVVMLDVNAEKVGKIIDEATVHRT